MKPGTRIVFFILILIALVHLWRLVSHFPVTVGSVSVPVWGSFLGVIIAGGLAYLLWREHRPG